MEFKLNSKLNSKRHHIFSIFNYGLMDERLKSFVYQQINGE